MNTPTRVLAVCSRNQWRSPTAENLINKLPGFIARSAGTAKSARVRLNQTHVQWADIILFMEHKHLQRTRSDYPDLVLGKTVHCLKYRTNIGLWIRS